MNFKPTINDLLAARKYNANKQPDKEFTTLKIGGKKIGTLQNVVVFSGKQKNGKSRYIGATIASALTREEIFTIQCRTPEGRPKVALFDTEQSDFDFYRQMNQIRVFAKLTQLPPTFEAFNTREDDPAEQIKMIDHYLEQNPDCSIIFIDGILDLLISYNDERESKHLTNFLKRISKIRNVLFILALHRSKGQDTTIGHLGSMIDRVAQSVLKVEKIKERNTYQLSAEYLRSDEDFTPVEIWYNAGIWEETFYNPEQTTGAKLKNLQARPEDYDKVKHITITGIAFSVNQWQTYDELIQNIKESWGVGRNWAVECLKYWRENNLIWKTEKGYTNIKQAKII